MEGSRSSVSTLHPREHSDVLTNSTAPRADNYFCARADLAFASSFTASFPLSLSLSSPLPFSSHFRANEFFVDRKHENPTPRLPFCAFFARPWGGRGEGYAGAWWPLQRFKSPQRTPREPPPLQRGLSIPRHPPLEAMYPSWSRTPSSNRKRSGRGQSWELNSFVTRVGFIEWVNLICE